MIEIHENYKGFVPPPWFRPTVERLLASLGPEHQGGLQSVVLTDGASIGRGKTHRVGGKKYDRKACLGFYHQLWRGEPAWIELVADNILSDYPAPVLWFRVVRDMVVGWTLYHEVGHHMDHTVGSATRGGEDAAEDWRRRLTRIHLRRHYWYLRPFLMALKPLVRLLRRLVR
jgi:hypothetical protein